MKWKRHGCITETVRHNKQQCPVVDIHNDGFWRIYYTHRCAKDRGYISYIDVEPGYPENILDYLLITVVVMWRYFKKNKWL